MRHFGLAMRAQARQWLAYAGVLLAAAASIATTEQEWELRASRDGLSAQLDAATPELVHHFTIEASDKPLVIVRGTPTWDAPEPAYGSLVIRVESDQGPADETSVASANGSEPFELMLDAPCSTLTCTQGYSVSFRFEGSADAKVELSWSFTARITGNGEDPPSSAYVRVSED